MVIISVRSVTTKQNVAKVCHKMNKFLLSWIDKWDRVVVFGGVFDPVHKGHLSAAKTALSHGRKVVFMPERKPQHKHGTTSYQHRLEMLKLATENESNLEVVDYPQDHHLIAPVFTWLKKHYPRSGFVWLVGSDVVEHIANWKGVDKLEALGVKKIIYFDREGEEKPETIQISNTMTAYKIKRPRFRKNRQKHASIRSKTIRKNMPTHHTQLPESVYDYIKKHDLYM